MTGMKISHRALALLKEEGPMNTIELARKLDYPVQRISSAMAAAVVRGAARRVDKVPMPGRSHPVVIWDVGE